MLIDIKIVAPPHLAEQLELPAHAKPGDAGLDLRACIEHDLFLHPDEVRDIPTGISVRIGSAGDRNTDNLVGLVFPRSGIGRKGLALANTVGVIDAGYTGEIIVAAWNRSLDRLHIRPFDRIAQLVIIPCYQVYWRVVEEHAVTDRGEGGYGSTGQ